MQWWDDLVIIIWQLRILYNYFHRATNRFPFKSTRVGNHFEDGKFYLGNKIFIYNNIVTINRIHLGTIIKYSAAPPESMILF